MAKVQESVNPFYVLLVIVGVVFVVTAFAYGTMAWRATQPVRQAVQAAQEDRPEQHPLLVFLDAHGIEMLTGELAVLGVATVAAMALDQRRARQSSTSPGVDREADAGAEPKIR